MEKKTTKQPVKPAPKKVEAKKELIKSAKVAPAKVEVKPVVKEEAKKPAVEAKPQVQAKKVVLHQDLNLLIGLFSIITIICFCFAFEGGDNEILGWEIFLHAGEYCSNVFKGLMIIYVIALFIDCILAIHVDSENEIFNIVEKVLYMFTVIMNFIVVAVLLSIVKKVGIGLIIFFIISVISAIVKFARIYSKK